MTAEKPAAAPHAAPDLINVQVRYPAAPRPFIDPKAQAAETLGQLKSRVLAAFEVAETQGPEQQVLFFFYHENERLDDLTRTLGQIAGEDRVLKLKLVQQIVQG
ncbi:MAG: hypothetical protein HY313_00350 [Acidobacteria bacterium]|nr:hypothetical protein [Acidobacteriota bacterium]